MSNYFEETCEYVHSVNKANGWHDNKRTVHDFYALFHSEPAEATEAVRHDNPPDNHLPQYPGVVVELIDTAIRCFDYLGSLECHKHTVFKSNANIDAYSRPIPESHTEMICQIHLALAKSYNLYINQRSNWVSYYYLLHVIAMCFAFVTSMGYDPRIVLEDKVEYNRTRHDHKPENRAKDDGKKM